ncbi:hypothetical protein BC831DRAFT_399789 [Entophlyctis helioformis]|nr:hypothetical protein BC831DRAFT_399789 [Entophlyctis helioformis]
MSNRASTAASAAASRTPTPTPTPAASAGVAVPAGQAINVQPLLASFVVFTSNRSSSEDTAEAARQICFYHPPNAPLETKVKQVGLLQALTAFTLTFPVSQPCEVVRTRKTRGALRQVEDGFWVFVKIRLGARVVVDLSGKKLAEYLDHELDDGVLDHIISQAYGRFKLFHRSFRDLQDGCGGSDVAFTETIESFFSTYVASIRRIGNMDLLTTLNGIHRMPLERPLSLRIATLVREIESSFGCISCTCVFFKHYLLWGGLQSVHDTHVFCDYISDPHTGTVYDSIPVISSRPVNFESNEAPRLERPATAASSLFGARSRPTSKYSGYVVGPDELDDLAQPHGGVTVKQVFIGDPLVAHALVVYQFEEDLTFAFFASLEEQDNHHMIIDPRMYSRLKARLEEVSPPLLESVTDAYRRQLKQLHETPDASYRFITHNRLNLAVKASIGATKALAISPDIQTLLGQLNDDLNSSRLGLTDAYVKTAKNAWVVAINTEDARVFLVIMRPDASLADITGMQ